VTFITEETPVIRLQAAPTLSRDASVRSAAGCYVKTQILAKTAQRETSVMSDERDTFICARKITTVTFDVSAFTTRCTVPIWNCWRVICTLHVNLFSGIWTLREVDHKYLENFEIWHWRMTENIRWTDRVGNGKVLHTVRKERNIIHTEKGGRLIVLVTSCVGTVF
jgi:hypothetical protein